MPWKYYIIHHGKWKEWFQRILQGPKKLKSGAGDGSPLLYCLHCDGICAQKQLTLTLSVPAPWQDVKVSWYLASCCLTTTLHRICLSPSLSSLPTGTLYARVQIQGVGVRELLCDILLHDISAAAVGQGLVPRSEQRGRNHEGEPCQEEQASSPLPSQTSKR